MHDYKCGCPLCYPSNAATFARVSALPGVREPAEPPKREPCVDCGSDRVGVCLRPDAHGPCIGSYRGILKGYERIPDADEARIAELTAALSTAHATAERTREENEILARRLATAERYQQTLEEAREAWGEAVKCTMFDNEHGTYNVGAECWHRLSRLLGKWSSLPAPLPAPPDANAKLAAERYEQGVTSLYAERARTDQRTEHREWCQKIVMARVTAAPFPCNCGFEPSPLPAPEAT